MYGDIGTYLKALSFKLWSSEFLSQSESGKERLRGPDQRAPEEEWRSHAERTGNALKPKKPGEDAPYAPAHPQGRSFYIDPSYIIRSAAPQTSSAAERESAVHRNVSN